MNTSEYLTAIITLVICIFYVPVAMIFVKRLKQRSSRKYFYTGVCTILRRVKDNHQASDEIKIIFRKLCESYPSANQRYKSPRDLLEDFFMRGNMLSDRDLKSAYDIELSDEEKARLSEIISKLQKEDPYGSVSSKHGNLLNMVDHSIETGNGDLGKNSLRSLADDIEIMESTINQQEKRNSVSITISVIGVILTLVFGAMTIIQFLNDQKSNQTIQIQAPNQSGDDNSE